MILHIYLLSHVGYACKITSKYSKEHTIFLMLTLLPSIYFLYLDEYHDYDFLCYSFQMVTVFFGLFYSVFSYPIYLL